MELHVGIDAEIAVGDAAVERLERAPDVGNIRLLPALGGKRGSGAFEGDTELEAALDVGNRAHRREAEDGEIGTPPNVAAGTLPRNDDAVLAQPRQRLAHHRAGGAEAECQLRLRGQAGIDGELAGDDALEDMLVDAAAEPAFEAAEGTLRFSPGGKSRRAGRSADRRRPGTR